MPDDPHRRAVHFIRRNPALLAMELLWRWSFGLGLLGLALYGYAQLRPAILVAEPDRQAFASGDPTAMSAACAEILAPILPLLFRLCVQLFLGGAVLWTLISTAGRAVITRTILRQLAAERGVALVDAPRWMTYLGLQAARALMSLILVIGYLGGLLLSSLVGMAEDNLLLAALVPMATFAAAVVVWAWVNRVLVLAPVLVARDGLLPLDAILAARDWRQRARVDLREISRRDLFFRLANVTAVTAAGVLVLCLPMPAWLLWALLALETLAYLVAADLLHLVRLAAWAGVALAERVATPENPPR